MDRKLLNHPKASVLLGALLGGMGGMGGMGGPGGPGMFGGEDDAEEMDFDSKQNGQSAQATTKPKEEEKPDPRANLSEEQRNVAYTIHILSLIHI